MLGREVPRQRPSLECGGGRATLLSMAAAEEAPKAPTKYHQPDFPIELVDPAAMARGKHLEALEIGATRLPWLTDADEWPEGELPTELLDAAVALAEARGSDTAVTARRTAAFLREMASEDAVPTRDAWAAFYGLHSHAFFHPRSFIHLTFPEIHDMLVGAGRFEGTSGRSILEIGCGNGSNALFFAQTAKAGECEVWASDAVQSAVDAVARHPAAEGLPLRLFQWDITRPMAEPHLFDLAVMTFVLSAISPGKMLCALRSVADVLAPGGLLCIRDYAWGDMKALGDPSTGRPIKGSLRDDAWLGGRCFRRDDGTLSYFFRNVELERLVKSVGLVPEPMAPHGWPEREFEAGACLVEYHTTEMVNRKTKEVMPRVVVCGQFRKPM
jgi:SAM-dependent methyltransferase